MGQFTFAEYFFDYNYKCFLCNEFSNLLFPSEAFQSIYRSKFTCMYVLKFYNKRLLAH